MFEQLNLSPVLLKRLKELEFTTPTLVQKETIPLLLEKKDVVGQAETGSGKTAAYGLPVLQMIDSRIQIIQVIVVVPTRELAIQVRNELKSYGQGIDNLKITAFYGGHAFSQELSSLAFPPQILISTPGRLADHINRGTVDLSNLRILIFDEADKLLELDFQEEIDQLMDVVPDEHQTILFSATIPEKVKSLISRSLKNPVFVQVSNNIVPEHLRFIAVKVDQKNKQEALVKLLYSINHSGTVIFVNTRAQAYDLAEYLRLEGFSAKALHGGMEQMVRDKTMTIFKNGSVALLVATDLASRGIDISSVSTIFHFELPDSEETFMHRSGRAGRIGRDGVVYTLLAPAEANKLRSWEKVVIKNWLSMDDVKITAPVDTTLDYATIHISGGRKDKISPKDIVGALIAETGLKAEDIGKIDVQEKSSFVAIPASQIPSIVSKLNESKIKGRKFKVKMVN